MSERQPLIAGNWKMHKTLAEARTLARDIRHGVAPGRRAEVALAPPYTALAAVAAELAGSDLRLAAQDTFWERQGAFTGAISPAMLADVGCHYVIVGHSERRQHFGETDEIVNRKLTAVMAAGLTPILCVGETKAEREADQTLQVVRSQLERGLGALTTNHRRRPGGGLRAGVGHRHRAHRHPGAGPDGAPLHPQPAAGVPGRSGRSNPHSVRRQRHPGQRRHPPGAAGYRRRPGGGRLPETRVVPADYRRGGVILVRPPFHLELMAPVLQQPVKHGVPLQLLSQTAKPQVRARRLRPVRRGFYENFSAGRQAIL